MLNIKKFEEFSKDFKTNENIEYISESINIEKFQMIFKKVLNEIGTHLYYASTFGTSLTILLPVVDKFMKSGDFVVETTPMNVTLLTVYAFSVLSFENKERINKLYQKLKEKNIEDVDIKKVVNLLRNIKNIFCIIMESSGKLISNFLDMVAYAGIFLPFLSVISSMVTKGSKTLICLLKILNH